MADHPNPSNRFDREAGTWDANPVRMQLATAVADAMLTRLDLQPQFEILDYGTGTGLIALRLKPHVRKIVAADVSPGMLAELEAKLRQSGIQGIEPLRWDAEHDPLPPRRFDAVVSSMTFHHLADVPAILRVFYKLTVPNGRLAVADLDSENGEFHPDPAGVHHRGFSREALQRQIAAAGFGGIEICTAHTVHKPSAGGEFKKYPVFLLTARKE